jgi:hypothetical protein
VKSRFSIILILVLILMPLLSACIPQASSGPKVSADSTAAPTASTEAVPSAEEPAPSDLATPPAGETPSAAPDAPVNCVWTLFVDQTIPKTVDGLKVDHHLMIVAQKTGGTDVTGTYKGVAYVGINFDASQLNNSAMQALGGFNVNVHTYALTFDVVAYEGETYSDYGLKPDEPPLAQLVPHESMALLSPEMTGTGTLDTTITGIQGEQGGTSNSSAGSTAITMKILINSGKVSVSVPSFGLTSSFEGMLTGVPLDGGSPDDVITQATEQIQTLLDQAAAEAEAAGDSMSDLIGQFMPK